MTKDQANFTVDIFHFMIFFVFVTGVKTSMYVRKRLIFVICDIKENKDKHCLLFLCVIEEFLGVLVMCISKRELQISVVSDISRSIAD